MVIGAAVHLRRGKVTWLKSRLLPMLPGHAEDHFLERAFWSRVSFNPPLYGADTEVSFFDDVLDFGWNLHDLGDLLQQDKVPKIPGVTTPMTYFGMWKVWYTTASPVNGTCKATCLTNSSLCSLRFVYTRIYVLRLI
jgi:hypothetical protein